MYLTRAWFRIAAFILAFLFSLSCNDAPVEDESISDGQTESTSEDTEETDSASESESEEDSEEENSEEDSEETSELPAGTLVISATIPGDLDVDTAIAMPVFRGKIEKDASIKAKKSSIASGALSLNIDTEETLFLSEGEGHNVKVDSHVLVTYKDTGDRFADAETMQFINVPLSDTENALNLFTSAYKDKTMELGDLTSENGQLIAAKSFTEEEFTDLSTEVLEELAKTDDALRSARNNFMNYDPETKEYMESLPYFQWNSVISPAINQFSPVTDTTFNYNGYGFYFSAVFNGFTLESLCLNSDESFKAIKLVPPVPVSTGTGDNTQTVSEFTNAANPGETPVINQGNGSRKECSGGGVYGYTYPEYPEVGFNWGGLNGAISEGYWKFYIEDQLKAQFDFAAVYPFDANDKPLVYIPSVKISVDPPTKEVFAVDIELYLYKNGSYQKITDPTAFKKIAANLGFSFTEHGDGGAQIEDYKEIEFIGGETLQLDLTKFNHRWFYTGDSSTTFESGKRLDKIAFQYEIYGSSFRFEYRQNLDGSSN